MVQIVEFDKFYTKREVAKFCIEQIPDMGSYLNIIEPSAGDGSFLDFLPKFVAYDIMPEDSRITQVDFLTVNKVFPEHTLCVGNPPFGSRGKLAKQFLKRCIFLRAETITFILPDTFRKRTNQSLFPKCWHLEKIVSLPENSFLVDGKDYNVPCSFFVWTTRRVEVDLREVPPPSTKDFIFLDRGNSDADFTVNGNSGKVKVLEQVTNPKAEHYIRHGVVDKYTLMNRFMELKYPTLSTVSNGNYWLNQEDILRAYQNYKEGEKRNDHRY